MSIAKVSKFVIESIVVPLVRTKPFESTFRLTFNPPKVEFSLICAATRFSDVIVLFTTTEVAPTDSLPTTSIKLTKYLPL